MQVEVLDKSTVVVGSELRTCKSPHTILYDWLFFSFANYNLRRTKKSIQILNDLHSKMLVHPHHFYLCARAHCVSVIDKTVRFY